MGVRDKIKKTSVKKDADKIEVTLGDDPLTKYEVMNAIAKTHSIYGATVWLNTQLAEYDNKTPAELMREGNMEAVAQILREATAPEPKKE